MNIIKIDRLSAWVLFISMLLYFISGYGMTKGIIDASLATKLHMSILTYLILVTFIFHTAYATRLALIRWGIWQSYGRIIWFIFFILFIASFIYIDAVYVKKNNITKTQETTTPTTSNNIDSGQTTTPTTEKTFTLAELAKYNGENGNQAYVAVDGNVYDLTTVFAGGFHYSHVAGTELTNAFYIKHAKSALQNYPVVGKLAQ